MNIMIAGGTGFIGQALIEHFLAQQHDITVLGRDLTKITKLFPSSISALNWQQFKLLSADKLSRFDVIINLAGANIGSSRWSEKQKKNIINSRTLTTEIISNALSQLGPNASIRLLNASAVGIYGFSSKDDKPTAFDEASPLQSAEQTPLFSVKVCQLWERATKTAQQANIPVTLMRFGVVLSTKGGALNRMILPFKLGIGGKMGSGRQPFAWIALSDLIKAIDFILAHPEIQGPVNLTAPTLTTQYDLSQTLAKVLHRPHWIVTPSWLIKFIFGQMGEELLLNGQYVIPQVLLKKGFIFDYPTIKTALQHIVQQQ